MDDLPDIFDVRGDGIVVLRLHVRPGAATTAVLGRHGDALKVAVAAPADRGRANDAVVELVAAVVGVPRRQVRLVSGSTSRVKRVEISGVTADAVRAAVGNATASPSVARRRR